MTNARFTPSLNCRPGDIARIIHRGHNLDRLVRVMEFSDDRTRPNPWHVEALQSFWCYRAHKWCEAGGIGVIDDSMLRPLRGGRGDDETLTWRRPVVQPRQVVR